MPKAVRWRHIIVRFIAYFISSFLVLQFSIGDLYKLIAEKTDNHKYQASFTKYCDSIGSVTSDGDIITVNYPSGLPKPDNFSLLSLFSLETSYSGQPISFPSGSSNLISSTNSSISFSFFLPVITNYTATLRCHILSNQSTFYSLILNVSSFSDEPYSRFKCFDDYFPRRYCEGRNLIYYGRKLIFLSPGSFSFPRNFIIPGSRPYPIDYEEDRLINEPIVAAFSLYSLPFPVEEVKKFSYLTGVFSNMIMLWHALFDFVLPIYSTMNSMRPFETAADRLVFIRSGSFCCFTQFGKVLSTVPVKNLMDCENPMLFRQFLLGLPKPEFTPEPLSSLASDSTRAGNMFTYPQLNQATAPKFKDEVFRELKLNWKLKGRTPNLVVIVNRSSSARSIVNFDTMLKIIHKYCESCETQVVQFENMEMDDQISIVNKASVLIGAHGSGLSHVLWMQPSTESEPTYLLELFPRAFSCRMWYGKAAQVARVRYQYYISPISDAGLENDEMYQNCLNLTTACHDYFCHDILRDKKIVIDENSFADTWKVIARDLQPV